MDFYQKAHLPKKRKSKIQLPKQEVSKRKTGMLIGDQKAQKLPLNDDNSRKIFSVAPLQLSSESDSDIDLSVINLDPEPNSENIFKPLNEQQLEDSDVSTISTLDSDLDDNDLIPVENEDYEDINRQNTTLSESGTLAIISSESGDSENSTSLSEFDKDGNLAKIICQKINTQTFTNTELDSSSDDVVINDDSISDPESLMQVSSDDSDLFFDVSEDDQSILQLNESKNVSEVTIHHDLEAHDSVSMGKPGYTIQNINKNDSDTTNSEPSPPYVSIVASDMESHNFDDIFAKYMHSTIKNLPASNSNDIPSEKPFDVSSIENCEVNEISQSFEGKEDTESYEEDAIMSPEKQDDFYQEIDDTDSISIQSDNDNVLCSSVSTHMVPTGCIFVLRHPATIYFYGKILASSLCGGIEILGYQLEEKAVEVFAPSYSCALKFQTLEKTNGHYGLFSQLTTLGLSIKDTEEIVISLNKFDAVLYLQPLKSKKLAFVEKNFGGELFSKNMRNITDRYFHNENKFLGCTLLLQKPWKCLEETSIWQEISSTASNSSTKAIVCGGKHVGKSTFLRYCANRHSGPVLVIDLDPGQSEFTVAGNISATVVDKPLLGPNFTHLKTPHRMLNVGMINILENLDRYLKAIKDLIAYCQSCTEFQNMPWIINTMGLCNSVGLKVMTYIILLIKPSLVIQIDSNVAKKRFETNLDSYSIRSKYIDYESDRIFQNMRFSGNLKYKFILLTHSENVNIKDNTSVTAKDERYLNFLAYFAQALTPNAKNGLLGVTPYVIPTSSLKVGSNLKLAQESVYKVINGKVVALCENSTNNSSPIFTLNEDSPVCYGHGLIRGVDAQQSLLYVVTPVRHKLKNINSIVYCDWTPDVTILDCVLPQGTVVPYSAAYFHHHKDLLKTPKRRFNPLPMLKAKRAA